MDKDLGLYATINNALDVDSRGRLWVVTHTRRWRKDEPIMRQYLGGQEQVIGDRTQTTYCNVLDRRSGTGKKDELVYPPPGTTLASHPCHVLTFSRQR